MQIKIEKRYIATIISIILLLAFAGYVIATSGVSHSWEEITGKPDLATKNYVDSKVADVGGIEGGAVIWFGDVGKILRDGASTTIPTCNYRDMIWGGTQTAYGQSKVENGKLYTRAWMVGNAYPCNSDWVEGNYAECEAYGAYRTTAYHYKATMNSTTPEGNLIVLHWKSGTGAHGPITQCTASGEWT
jgi:hypothetical protein